MKLGDQFESVKVTFLSRPAFPGACITHDLHRQWVPFVFDIAFMNKLFLDEIVMEEIWNTADALEIWNHSGSWLSMMEAFSPLFINFIEQMILQFKMIIHTWECWWFIQEFHWDQKRFVVPLPYYCDPCHVLLLLPGHMQLCENSNFVLFPGQLDDWPDWNNWHAEGEAWRSRWCSQECSSQQREKKVLLEDTSFIEWFTGLFQALDNLWDDQSNHPDPRWWVTSCSEHSGLLSNHAHATFAGAPQSWAEQKDRKRREPQNPNLRENQSPRTTTTASRSQWVETHWSPACPRLV